MTGQTDHEKTPPAPVSHVMGSDPIQDAIAILQTAVAGNCEHKNRHGYGDCGAEKIIADVLAVLRRKGPAE